MSNRKSTAALGAALAFLLGSALATAAPGAGNSPDRAPEAATAGSDTPDVNEHEDEATEAAEASEAAEAGEIAEGAGKEVEAPEAGGSR